jgi:hypothetical protein
MKKQWKKVWVKVATWLVAEIILNLSGLDTLADYSEFLFERSLLANPYGDRLTFIASFYCGL